MRKYDKEFKEEAVKLSDEVGIKQMITITMGPIAIHLVLAQWNDFAQ